MEAVRKKLRRLKVYFGVVWGFNLAEYGIFGYLFLWFARDVGVSGFSSTDDLWQVGLVFFLLLFPCIFNYLALRLLRNYYPARELPSWKRWLYNILGVLQIIIELFLGIAAVVFLLKQFPRTPYRSMDMRVVIAYLWTVSMIAAAVWNLSAVVVVWRIMRVIRRNYRVALLETF